MISRNGKRIKYHVIAVLIFSFHVSDFIFPSNFCPAFFGTPTFAVLWRGERIALIFGGQPSACPLPEERKQVRASVKIQLHFGAVSFIFSSWPTPNAPAHSAKRKLGQKSSCGVGCVTGALPATNSVVSIQKELTISISFAKRRASPSSWMDSDTAIPTGKSMTLSARSSWPRKESRCCGLGIRTCARMRKASVT